MKKIVGLLVIVEIMLSMTMTVLAGDIPESLLHSDDAQIFFAEVVYYHPNKENPDIEFSPVKKIKGDVKLGTKQIAYNFNTIGGFDIKEGNVYLFTYFDENNPTDIFDVTSYDTSTMKLKKVEGDMWERFEQYLNEGRYLAAEHNRIDKQNELLVKSQNTITLTEYLKTDDVSLGTISVYSGPRAAEVERKEFLKVSDTIHLKEIEKADLEIENGHGFHISAPESMGFVYISSDGKVSKNNPDGNTLKDVEYVIESTEIAKLEQFVADDDYNLPPLETPLAKDIFYGVLMGIICGGIAGIIIYAVRKKKKSK